MKCKKCRREFEENKYPVCPFCHREKTSKELNSRRFWEFIFFIMSIGIFLLCGIGLESLLGWKYTSIPLVFGFFIFVYSCIKRREKEKKILIAEIEKVLKGEEFENISRGRFEIFMAVENCYK